MKRFGTLPHNKFGATKTIYKGIVFDSTYERDRYIYLLDRQRKGEISYLRRQVEFLLIPQVKKLVPKQLKTKTKYVERVVEMEARYHNDFCYIENGKYISEEFKSEYTSKLADYILRRKIMVHKIYEHNKRNHGQWVFREVIYDGRNKTTITDK